MVSRLPFFLPQLRVYQIWGADQGAGKTIASILLAWCAAKAKISPRKKRYVGYVKPLTVDIEDGDQIKVNSSFGKVWPKSHRPKWLKASSLMHWTSENGMKKDEGDAAETQDSLAYEIAGAPRSKDVSKTTLQLTDHLQRFINKDAKLIKPPAGWLFMETLGSPTTRLPWGLSQVDTYASAMLNFPSILVCQAHKEGVDKVITAYEALRARDTDVQAVIVFEEADEAQKHRVEAYFEERLVPCAVLREIPSRHPVKDKDKRILHAYFSEMSRSNTMRSLLRLLDRRHLNITLTRLAGSNDEDDIAFLKNARSESSNIWPNKALKYNWALPPDDKNYSPEQALNKSSRNAKIQTGKS